MEENISVEVGEMLRALAEPNLPQCHSRGTPSSRPSGTPASGQTVFAARRAMSGAGSCARKGLIEKTRYHWYPQRHGKILLYERYRAPNWKSRPLYILAAWMKLFAATRSKRKFNNPVSFDEIRHMRGCGSWVPSGSSAIRKLELSLVKTYEQSVICTVPHTIPRGIPRKSLYRAVALSSE